MLDVELHGAVDDAVPAPCGALGDLVGRRPVDEQPHSEAGRPPAQRRRHLTEHDVADDAATESHHEGEDGDAEDVEVVALVAAGHDEHPALRGAESDRGEIDPQRQRRGLGHAR